MILIEKFTNEIAEQWDNYVSSHSEGTYCHLAGWRDIIENSFGHKSHYLYAIDDDRIKGLLPLIHLKSYLFGSFIVSLPFLNYGGILADNDHIQNLLKDSAISIAKELNAEFVELRHTFPRNLEFINKQHKIAMLLKLPEDPEILWKNLKAKVRNQIRKAEKNNLRLQIGREDILDDFYKVFSINMRDLGTPVYSRRFFKNILLHFESARICTAYYDKYPVASGFVIGMNNKLDIPWASSIRKYNSLNGNMLIYWKILKYACENGYMLFDFGRCSPDESTYRFKKQWGAEPLQLTWQYWMGNGNELPDISPKNSKYELMINIWRQLPTAITNRIGPSIIKYIP